MSYSKHFSFSLVTVTVSDSLFNSQNISSWSSSFNFNAMFFTKVGIICLHLWRASVSYDILSRWLIDQSKCYVAKLHSWDSRNPPKIEIQKICSINGSHLYLHQFDKFWISSVCNDQKRKLCEGHYSDSCTVLPGKSRENEMVKCLKIHISRLLSPSFQLQQKNDSILFLFPTMTWLKCRLGCKTINVKNFLLSNLYLPISKQIQPIHHMALLFV